jgi:lipoprotein-releasing system permease protein
LNFELFLAKRIHFSKVDGDNKRATPPVVRIAMAGIALGLAVMIISVAVVVGFKKEVRNKVIGFNSHIQLTNFDNNISYESIPISIDDSLRNAILSYPEVSHIEEFATKPGIIKTDSAFQGIVLKGMAAGYDSTFFRKNLIEGNMINVDSVNMSNQALISEALSKMLGLACGDSFLTYFIENETARARKFLISGIYSTGFDDYDKLFVVCDIKQIKRINRWDDDMASGLSIFIRDYDRLDDVTEELYFSLIDKKDKNGNTYYIRSIKELNPLIFNWLSVLDSNVAIIIILMITVSGFTMISGILIIILERANMIGILKALGQTNKSIRTTFLYVAFFLIVKGMFWGNLTGLGFCFLQSHFQWFKLDSKVYYIDSVPIDIGILSVVLINIGSLLASMFMMIAPSYMITKIEPAKSIRFE